MIIRALFNGIERDVLVDTGSDVSILPNSLVPNVWKIETNELLNLNSASRVEIKMLGEVKALIIVTNVKIA